jgi:hypothetical protein
MEFVCGLHWVYAFAVSPMVVVAAREKRTSNDLRLVPDRMSRRIAFRPFFMGRHFYRRERGVRREDAKSMVSVFLGDLRASVVQTLPAQIARRNGPVHPRD